MYTDEDIASAVAAGVLSQETATALRAHVDALKHTTAADEEHFKLVTGFNDIFVVIACVLLLASVAGIGAAFSSVMGAALTSLTAWLLAEFFVRQRRMALPAIVLLLAFVGGVFATGFFGFGSHKSVMPLTCMLAALAAWLHWRRFQVPITIAAGTASALGFVIALILISFPEAMRWMTPITFVAGLLAFWLAMRWDASDLRRESRRSDVAFWLHLLAAPMLVHPLFSLLGVLDGQATLAQGLLIVLIYVMLALVSLCLDRRALMVSALGYVFYAFTALLKQYGVISLSFAITALVIGSALLLLSAFWHPSRAYVLGFVPASIKEKLTPAR